MNKICFHFVRMKNEKKKKKRSKTRKKCKYKQTEALNLPDRNTVNGQTNGYAEGQPNPKQTRGQLSNARVKEKKEKKIMSTTNLVMFANRFGHTEKEKLKKKYTNLSIFFCLPHFAFFLLGVNRLIRIILSVKMENMLFAVDEDNAMDIMRCKIAKLVTQ